MLVAITSASSRAGMTAATAGQLFGVRGAEASSRSRQSQKKPRAKTSASQIASTSAAKAGMTLADSGLT